MKKILVIDDERMPRFPAIVIRSGDRALEYIKDVDHLDELWLDHDLGGDDTTREVVSYLEEKAYFGDPLSIDKVMIHTSNPVGREWIYSALSRIYDVEKVQAGDWF